MSRPVARAVAHGGANLCGRGEAGGSWTLEFGIRPTSAKKQVLFSHHAHDTGSVTVYLENGEISSEYTDRHLKSTQQRPGLKLPLNEWSRVRISYNLSTMTYTVNGQSSKALPAPGPGLYLGASVFGGLGSATEYFGGGLRSLRMVHRALWGWVPQCMHFE